MQYKKVRANFGITSAYLIESLRDSISRPLRADFADAKSGIIKSKEEFSKRKMKLALQINDRDSFAYAGKDLVGKSAGPLAQVVSGDFLLSTLPD